MSTSSSTRTLRLGTRGSQLARWQAEWVAGQLGSRGVQVELVPISTQGDQQQTGPIGAIGTFGVFTKELQRALLEDRIDLAVHSLKDLPTEVVPGLALACVPARGPSGDVLVCRREGMNFRSLPVAALVGTGSLRRRSQLLHARPDLQMRECRGNVDTRLRKLHEGQYDALVLADAGLTRLELTQFITERLPTSLLLPAVGQGALGIETRADDAATREALAWLDDSATHASVTAERSLLATLRGGCLAPVGAWARPDESGQLRLDAVVCSVLGTQRLGAGGSAPVDAAEDLGRRVAEELIAAGARELIAASRAAAATQR